MMNYDDFQATFIKENKRLRIILGIALVIFSVGTINQVIERRYYLYRGGTIFEERPLAEEVCRQSFLSLTAGSPNPFVVSPAIIDLVKKEPFNMNIEKILQIKSLEVGACKIILKSEGKLLAFKITLQGEDSNPFFYKLTQVDELPADKEDK